MKIMILFINLIFIPFKTEHLYKLFVLILQKYNNQTHFIGTTALFERPVLITILLVVILIMKNNYNFYLQEI